MHSILLLGRYADSVILIWLYFFLQGQTDSTCSCWGIYGILPWQKYKVRKAHVVVPHLSILGSWILHLDYITLHSEPHQSPLFVEVGPTCSHNELFKDFFLN